MRNWSHITSVCACSCWRCPYNVSQSITVSTTRLHTRARTHTLSDYSLASIIFKRKACSHMNRYRSGVSNTSVCVRVCVYVYRLFQNQAYAQHTHNLSTQKPEHTQWICSLSTAACFIAPVETSPSSTFLFNMQGINCLHDKLQPSQLRPCDIYTRVVYKHRCGNIISGFVWRMSRESSVLYALMNHAVTSSSTLLAYVLSERQHVHHVWLWWCDCLHMWCEACDMFLGFTWRQTFQRFNAGVFWASVDK